jgi:hypothetical protein
MLWLMGVSTVEQFVSFHILVIAPEDIMGAEAGERNDPNNVCTCE